MVRTSQMKIGGERPLRGVQVGVLPEPVLPVPLKISRCAGNERVTDLGKCIREWGASEARRGDVRLSIFVPFLSLLILSRSLLSLFSCVVVAVVAIYLSFLSFLMLNDLILLITHQALINCYTQLTSLVSVCKRV